MIERYLAGMKKVRPLGKNKHATLNAIGESYFGELVLTGRVLQEIIPVLVFMA